MENFAHLYLAFNQDRDRLSESTAPDSAPIPSSWAAPIAPASKATPFTSYQEAPSIQDADVDFDTLYPSFYL